MKISFVELFLSKNRNSEFTKVPVHRYFLDIFPEHSAEICLGINRVTSGDNEKLSICSHRIVKIVIYVSRYNKINYKHFGGH